MKVVLDTNVWVSALAFPGGTCDQLLQYFIRHPLIEIITSPFILHEFGRVLGIPIRSPREVFDRLTQ